MSLASKLQVVSNAAIVVATCAISVFAWKYVSASAAPVASADPESFVAGESIPGTVGLDTTKADQTLVMYVHSTCRYCRESLPFYRHLAALKSTSPSLQIVVASRESTQETEQYAAASDLRPDAFIQVTATPKLFATPTLVLVDRHGKAIKSWVGKLTDEGEAEVLRLTGLANATTSPK